MTHNTEQDYHSIEKNMNDAIERLSKMSPLTYESIRNKEAENLGVRVTELDKEVKKARFKLKSNDESKANDELESGIEPWSESVDTIALVREIKQIIGNYCVLPEGGRIAMCLWVLGTYCFDAFNLFPRMLITSPERGCGKSTALMLLHALSNRGLLVSNIKPAALFRSVELWSPSLMIDEADTFLNKDSELNGIINSGHTKGTAFTLRCNGDEHIPTKFSTWSPLAIAMINLPKSAPLIDRSITIKLKRKAKGIETKRMPPCLHTNLTVLRSKCQRWENDNIELLQDAFQGYRAPQIGSDRNQDNWASLLLIASIVDEGCLEEAKIAMAALELKDKDVQSDSNQLLEDVRDIFIAGGYVYLHSVDLVEKLVALEERPWSEFKNDRPITTAKLGRMLKSYGIHSKDIRVPHVTNQGAVKKGYRREDLEPIWVLYLDTDTSKTKAIIANP